jgi:hypothetical protein
MQASVAIGQAVQATDFEPGLVARVPQGIHPPRLSGRLAHCANSLPANFIQSLLKQHPVMRYDKALLPALAELRKLKVGLVTCSMVLKAS